MRKIRKLSGVTITKTNPQHSKIEQEVRQVNRDISPKCDKAPGLQKVISSQNDTVLGKGSQVSQCDKDSKCFQNQSDIVLIPYYQSEEDEYHEGDTDQRKIVLSPPNISKHYDDKEIGLGEEFRFDEILNLR